MKKTSMTLSEVCGVVTKAIRQRAKFVTIPGWGTLPTGKAQAACLNEISRRIS